MRKTVEVPPEELQKSLQASASLKKELEGRGFQYYIESYGCQMNDHDAEKLSGMLQTCGFSPAPSKEEATLLLFNTCCVREHAEKRVFGNIGALKKRKEDEPGLLIGVCGCMMQQREVAERLFKRFPFVDLVFGTHELHHFPLLLSRTLAGERVFSVRESDGEIVEGLPVVRGGSFSTFVTIMYGCNNFCSYCIVPYVRGRERSRHPADIIAEAKQLIADGYKEITLLGQNVNSYGKGLEENINFSKLLRMLNDLDGDFILRFMTSHPKDATPELIDTIAECEKVCKHLHLPVQSGSDRILDLMNRHYHVEDYRKLIAYARKKIPDISFTSDIIVGFPNETEEDFQATLDLIREVRYHFLYTFIYSKRVGTKAAAMEDLTPEQEKSRRFRELLSVQEVIGQEIYDKLVGTTCRVLVDGEGKSGEGYLTGRTEQSVIVDFQGDKQLIGSFVQVRITKALRWAVVGELDV